MYSRSSWKYQDSYKIFNVILFYQDKTRIQEYS